MVTWLAAASVLAVPAGAVVLSMTEAYDGYKIYWEGLVALPLVSAGVLLAAELKTRGVRDKVTDYALVYLWDALRGRALRVITAIGVYGVCLSWEMAAGGVLGVARIQPFPASPYLYALAAALADTLQADRPRPVADACRPVPRPVVAGARAGDEASLASDGRADHRVLTAGECSPVRGWTGPRCHRRPPRRPVRRSAARNGRRAAPRAPLPLPAPPRPAPRATATLARG